MNTKSAYQNLDILEALRKTNDLKQATSKIDHWKIPRVESLLSSVCENFSSIYSNKLRNKISLKREDFCANDVYINFQSNGCVGLSLSLSCHHLEIALPYEVIHEISSSTIRKEHENILHPPTEEDLKAFGASLANLLNEVSSKKMFITGIKSLEDKKKRNTFLKNTFEEDSKSTLLFRLTINETDYPLTLFVTKSLEKEFFNSAQRVFPSNASIEQLKQIEINWKIKLNKELCSINKVLSLQEGSFIPLLKRHSTDSELPLILSDTSENLNPLAAMLASTSKPGLFFIKLDNDKEKLNANGTRN